MAPPSTATEFYNNKEAQDDTYHYCHELPEEEEEERKDRTAALSSSEWDNLNAVAKEGFTVNDQIDMKRMGKKQQFRRSFKLVTSIAFTSCVMGTWEILLTSNTLALFAGGSAGLFWSLCWAYTGQTFIVLSLAEMSSMAPTAGAQYHWVSEFAPRDWQRLLSYLSGWLSTVSWQSIVAADCYLVGVIIQGLIIENNANYGAERWQATLLIFAAAIVTGLFLILGARHLPVSEAIFVTLHFLAFFPIIIVILVMAPNKRSARSVFLEFSDNGSAWPNLAWSTLVGQVSAMFTVLGSDSVAHMAEEIEDAGIVVPRSMIWSFLINTIPTFGLLISYLFCMPNVADAVADRTTFPFIYVFRNATGSVGGTTGMTVVVLILIIMITASAMASTSRQTFAFARDNGLPVSGWIGHVSNTFHVPVNSIILTCGFTILVSLINIGSTVAFNAMLSLSTTALFATYLISIFCIALKRIRKEPLPPARWSLGKFGLPVNICGMLYACWGFFWCFWPNAYNVNAQNLNYAVVLFVGLMSIAGVVYFVYARKVYEGPVMKVRTM